MQQEPSNAKASQGPTQGASAPAQAPVEEEGDAPAPLVVDADPSPEGVSSRFPQMTGSGQAFYTREGSMSDEAGFAAPFQFSGAIPQPPGPAPDAMQATGTITTPPPSSQGPRWLRPLLWGLPILIVALLLLGSLIGFAAPSRPLVTRGAGRPTAPVKGPASPSVPPSPAPTHATTPGSSWSLSPLPAGWTAAGLSGGDAAFAMRTAMTFTDREMSLDYRMVGTRAQHGGTMTAATFLLTPAARTRFQHNDVRVINDGLFDRLTQQQGIQAVTDETPRLVQFQMQRGQPLAWVDVTFHLWQSRLDPAHTGRRIEGLDPDPATGRPRLHRMSVLLLRVAPGTQGPNAPMGGTGWLVSNYGLDLPGQTVVDLVLPA